MDIYFFVVKLNNNICSNNAYTEAFGIKPNVFIQIGTRTS